MPSTADRVVAYRANEARCLNLAKDAPDEPFRSLYKVAAAQWRTLAAYSEREANADVVKRHRFEAVRPPRREV
jgi:hypothetical protein